jgi:hypothetical protein
LIKQPSAYLDSNILLPYYLSDLVLTLAHYGFYKFYWSEYLLDEMREVAERKGKQRRSLDSLNSQWQAIHSSGLSKNLIAESAWKEMLPKISGPDLDDYPHAAAAIAGGMDFLVTENLRDFNANLLLSNGVKVIGADDFLLALTLGQEEFMIEVLRKRVSEFSKPELTLGGYLQGFSKTTPNFAEHLRATILKK